MANPPNSRAATGLPNETLAEVQDGIALALDALGARRIQRQDIEEALGHLRFAARRVNHIAAGDHK